MSNSLQDGYGLLIGQDKHMFQQLVKDSGFKIWCRFPGLDWPTYQHIHKPSLYEHKLELLIDRIREYAAPTKVVFGYCRGDGYLVTRRKIGADKRQQIRAYLQGISDSHMFSD